MGVTMSREQRIAAFVCVLAVLCVAAGFAWFSIGAGLIALGVLAVAWVLVFLDVGLA